MARKVKKNLEGSTMNDLVSISEAARIRGVTHGAIQDLIERGRLEPIVVAGRRLLRRNEVTGLEKLPAGRPPKASGTNGNVKVSAGKKGSKK
jgi:hypothetical protein